MTTYWVYILQSDSTWRYYIGVTVDAARRISEHNRGKNLSTKGRGPWRLVYQESHSSRSSAQKRELQIKRMKSRAYIESLIQSSENAHS